jgi:Cd2+-exporting ATPase
MQEGKKVFFCGDGTNDAVAVAQADIGIQLGSSSDVTSAAADVILLSGLEGLRFLIDISKAAVRRVVFNFI